MMLSQRVGQPLVGLARLVEEYEEVNAAIGEGGFGTESSARDGRQPVGLRPKLVGAISFQDVTFTYGGSKVPALDRVSFSIPRRHNARNRRSQRFGQVHDHPSVAGAQPRLRRFSEDRRVRICATSTFAICGRASA